MTTSACRICPNSCPLEVEIVDAQVAKISGGPANELFQGYSCVKGRNQHEFMRRPDRVLRSMKRTDDGCYAPIPVEHAMDETAIVLQRILDEHGPRSIAGSPATPATSCAPPAVGPLAKILIAH